MTPFNLRSHWDAGWHLSVNGADGAPGSFAEAAAQLQLTVQPGNLFDRAYASEIDTRLTWDGQAFVCSVPEAVAVSPQVATLAEIEAWLDAAIRRELPGSKYAKERT